VPRCTFLSWRNSIRLNLRWRGLWKDSHRTFRHTTVKTRYPRVFWLHSSGCIVRICFAFYLIRQPVSSLVARMLKAWHVSASCVPATDVLALGSRFVAFFLIIGRCLYELQTRMRRQINHKRTPRCDHNLPALVKAEPFNGQKKKEQHAASCIHVVQQRKSPDGVLFRGYGLSKGTLLFPHGEAIAPYVKNFKVHNAYMAGTALRLVSCLRRWQTVLQPSIPVLSIRYHR